MAARNVAAQPALLGCMSVNNRSKASGRGRFVVFEGLDGAGTTTQVNLLADWLAAREVAVEVTNEPTNGPIGAILRQALQGRVVLDPVTMALAFAADRTDHLFDPARGILRSLDLGHWVVCDRYLLSSLAYQMSEEAGLEWLLEANRHAATPDLTVFVDTPPEVCLKRIAARSNRRDLFENETALRRTLENYRVALDRCRDQPIAHIDGDQPAEAVSADVVAAVTPLLRR
jgi:dTMP kinase